MAEKTSPGGERRDCYEVLGVAKTASQDEIRKAYRQAALKNHPDRNPDDCDAAARFKEATEAFQILSDEEKKARYDRFGFAGVEGAAPGGFDGDIFTHFQDIFSEFFGGAGGPGGQQRRRNGPSRGQDVRVQQRITLKEALTGCKREVPMRLPTPCEVCEGSGAKAGTKRKTCGTCGGVGQVSSSRGFVMFTQTCPECSGEGQVVKSPCDACRGAGMVEKQRKVVVTFPAGIDGGQRMRVPGQGMPGRGARGEPGGGPAGDLFVDVDIAPDPNFERDGLDLVTRAKISFADAAMGRKVEVVLPHEEKVEVEIPAGTQPGEVVSLRGRGAPRIDGRGRGALHVVVQIEVPKNLSTRARELLVELAEELSPTAPPVSTGGPASGGASGPPSGRAKTAS